MYLPVGGLYIGQKLEKPVSTWNAAFKWKPPEDNTIDFLVKFKKGNTNSPLLTFVNSVPHRILDLFVGYDPSSWDKITARTYLEGNFLKKKAYLPISFKPGDVVGDDITSCFVPFKAVCENDDSIEDDSIVEFRYDTTDPYKKESLKWVPIRVRKDKTEMYRRTKSLSGAVICGKELVDTLPPEDDVYYERYLNRDLFASKNMMNFNNDVKRKLIVANKGDSVLDLACGKGGDLRKYIQAGFTKILGFDGNRDNIENGKDGAYSRLYDYTKKAPNVKAALLPFNLSQKIDVRAITDADDKHVAQVIYGLTQDAKLGKFHKFAVDKFDLVSCQFAIHYFFENEKILDNFLSNVDSHIKDGGVFIGTCLNGKEVKNLLGKDKYKEGELKSRVLWHITKLYSKDTDVGFGEEIEVYMESIGHVIKEYLVNIDILHKKMKILGYEMIENKGFGDYYEDSFNLSADEKKYSDLNMTFAFKKINKRVFKKKI
jgi:SAM-dependent methyltransferase